MVCILLLSMLRHLLICLAFYLKETPALFCRFLYDPAMFWIHKGTQNTNVQDKLG